MPLSFDDLGQLKRGRGRPSAADRAFELRLRAEAEAELARELDPTVFDDDGRFSHGTRRWKNGPPAISGRTAVFVALIASGLSDDAARRGAKLQQRAIRRLLATSELFRAAIVAARIAAATAG